MEEKEMRITAITKFKHADMYEAMKKLGWSYRNLSDRSGVNIGHIGDILRLKRRPSTNTNFKIHKSFLEEGVYLDILETWPLEFKGTIKSLTVVQFKDVEAEVLCSNQHELIEYNEDFLAKEGLHESLKKLTLQERKVLDLMYLSDGNNCSETSKIMGVCSARIQQIHSAAIKKLRRPLTIKLMQ